MRLNIIAFVAGVCLLQMQPVLPHVVWILALFPLISGAWVFHRLPGPPARCAHQILLKLFCLSAGFLWAAAIASLRLQQQLPATWEGRDIRLAGVVASLPQPDDNGTRFDFDVERVLTPEASVPPHIHLTWTPGAGAPGVHAGERWQLTARLRRPHGNYNPHGFDFEAWLLERNLRATGYVRAAMDNARTSEFVFHPTYLVERVRENIRDRFVRVLGERPYAGVLVALVIGDESAIPRDQWQVFFRTGVNHLMSISGLHITMIAGLALGLVYWAWRRSPQLTLRCAARKAAAIAGMLAAFAYTLIAGFAVPAQRTLYMLSVIAVAMWLGRMGSASRVLCLTLLLVALLDPWAPLSPGFWLSFGAVAAIFFVNTGRVGHPGWLASWARVQWAVTLGLVPPMLALFQQISLVSPLANAFAVPAISLVVAPLTLASAVLPIGGLLVFSHAVMALCMQPLIALSDFPSAIWQQHAPPAWAVALGLGGVLLLLSPRGTPARWLGWLWLGPLFLVPPGGVGPDGLLVTVLDVGQGLAVVARTHKHALLYDTGPAFASESDSGSRIIVPFLRGEGIEQLDGMVVSHADRDHSGGAVSVMEAVPVSWFLSSLPPEHEILRHAPQDRFACYAGQTWEWDGVRFDVLHPDKESYSREKIKTNDRGCVVKITSPNGSVLLPADVETRSETAMLERSAQLLASDVLVAPHHGSKTSSSEMFIRQVHPSWVIFPVGYRNRFGHPNAMIVARYQALPADSARTDEYGATEIRIDAHGVSVVGFRARQKRYWQAG